MAKLFSNELKAIVVPEDFLENPKNVLKENCLVVQHFDYQAEHKRNSAGEVYGPTEPVMLKFTIRVNSPRHARVFYSNLLSNAHSNYSFLFNATFNSYQRLANYEDSMVVNGNHMFVEILLQHHRPATLLLTTSGIFVGCGRVTDHKDRGGFLRHS